MLKVSIVIPTLNPSERILTVVKDLKDTGFDRFIIVNDGSKPEKDVIFEALEKDLGCTVLKHEVNRGKGCGLKTAMSYFLEYPLDHIGVITLDDDGQHTLEDTVKLAKALEAEPDKLILGARDFDSPNVPPKSKFGNKITRFFMRTACGLNITDTQTGLRAIPKSAMADFISVKGDRFEYETNMLLEAGNLGIEIKEVLIETVYIEENKHSHFNPIVDSIRIYKQLLKFTASSLLSFLIDIGLFKIFTMILPLFGQTLIWTATFAARVLSSLFNFFANKKVVYQKSGSTLSSLGKYYALCIVQTSLSALFVTLLSSITNGGWMTAWKLVVDICLFFASYKIQRVWVFSKKK